MPFGAQLIRPNMNRVIFEQLTSLPEQSLERAPATGPDPKACPCTDKLPTARGMEEIADIHSSIYI